MTSPEMIGRAVIGSDIMPGNTLLNDKGPSNGEYNHQGPPISSSAAQNDNAKNDSTPNRAYLQSPLT